MKQRSKPKVILNDVDDETKDDEIFLLKEVISTQNGQLKFLANEVKKMDCDFYIALSVLVISALGHMITASYLIYFI
jgi:hypothetical protein